MTNRSSLSGYVPKVRIMYESTGAERVPNEPELSWQDDPRVRAAAAVAPTWTGRDDQQSVMTLPRTTADDIAADRASIVLIDNVPTVVGLSRADAIARGYTVLDPNPEIAADYQPPVPAAQHIAEALMESEVHVPDPIFPVISAPVALDPREIPAQRSTPTDTPLDQPIGEIAVRSQSPWGMEPPPVVVPQSADGPVSVGELLDRVGAEPSVDDADVPAVAVFPVLAEPVLAEPLSVEPLSVEPLSVQPEPVVGPELLEAEPQPLVQPKPTWVAPLPEAAPPSEDVSAPVFAVLEAPTLEAPTLEAPTLEAPTFAVLESPVFESVPVGSIESSATLSVPNDVDQDPFEVDIRPEELASSLVPVLNDTDSNLESPTFEIISTPTFEVVETPQSAELDEPINAPAFDVLEAPTFEVLEAPVVEFPVVEFPVVEFPVVEFPVQNEQAVVANPVWIVEESTEAAAIPSSVEPSPIEPSPVEPSPVEPSWVEPSSVVASPAVDAPEAYAPIAGSAGQVPSLAMRGVTRTYIGPLGSVPVLDQVSLDIAPGDRCVIRAASGAGSTTLLTLLAGFEAPDEGQIFVNGEAMASWNEADRARFRAAATGFLPQNQDLVDDLHVRDNVSLPLLAAGWSTAAAHEESERVLASVGMSARLTFYPSQLSRSERVRTALARALVGDPFVLLADDPTAGLDDELADLVASSLLTHNTRGATLVVVSRDHRFHTSTSRIADLADRQLTLHTDSDPVVTRHHA
jgi:predicted ABC-type transport system involved in lysophospholipase L1 biosynthesis ATPase subunit